ncbi:DUF559 domain-containing protein [Saccharothrix syringae]|uniref:DUF559 domain-containing protein n=1 Tax=Saccharothrix syringae TaxID=103733 RepID=A0A5Q0HAJ3_SACSY|nr:DUF559 domain-containing protein [Saccharothrix syringae]QFZ23268.1 DUF559 domain-containing protein [Saccharothrix syringae]
MIQIPEGLHGAYPRTALHAHLGPKGLQRAIQDGHLVSYCRTVVIQRARMTNLHTRAAAALLMAGPDAALSNHTSAWLHGCTAAETARVHLTIGYNRAIRPRPGVAVHQQTFDPTDVIELDGLRCLVIEHAISEMLCRGRRSTALACADQALAQVASGQRSRFKADLAARIAARRDPRGRRQGLLLLDLSTGLPESPAESTLLLLIAEAGFPVPEPQYSVCDLDGREIWRLDFAWPDRRVALEYDGYAAHVGKADADQARADDLRQRGWTVLRGAAPDLRDTTRLFRHLSAALAAPTPRSRRFWL